MPQYQKATLHCKLPLEEMKDEYNNEGDSLDPNDTQNGYIDCDKVFHFMKLTQDKDDPDIKYRKWIVFKVIDEEYGLRALGYNKYETEKTKLPKNWIKKRLFKWEKDEYCREKIPEPDLDGLEQDKWLKKIANKCLTIKDIKEMNDGDEIKVLVMDRNLYDRTCSVNKPNKLYTAEYFFRHNTATYKHYTDLKGELTFHWTDKDYKSSDFEFDIEYEKNNWYPLENGKLPKNDPQGLFEFPFGKEMDWTEFPESTKIGWRGEMMLWDKVILESDIYWYES